MPRRLLAKILRPSLIMKIKEQIKELTKRINQINEQRIKALRYNQRKSAQALQSVQTDLDYKIIELERMARQ
jgi:hypothetical protein